MTPPSGSSASYSYDGDGLRTTKTVGASTSRFLWDQTASTPLLLKDGQMTYLYGPDGLPVEQLDQAGTPTYYHHDQLGSTRVLTDATGATSASFTYSAFGALTAHTGSQSTPLGFAGQYVDSETGFEYLRARYFDPATGQFLTVDPKVDVTRAAYAYAGNDPVNRVDPTGLSEEMPGGAGGDPLPGPEPGASQSGGGGAGETSGKAGEAAESEEAAEEIVNGEGEPVCQPIETPPDAVKHVNDRHLKGGADYIPGKSSYVYDSEDVTALINGAQSYQRNEQPNGNFNRVINAGHVVGVDATTGKPTSVYTVVTTPSGELVTAHPGMPRMS